MPSNSRCLDAYRERNIFFQPAWFTGYVSLRSSLGAFGMRKPERIPGRTYCLDIGRRLLSLEIVTIQSIPRNHSYFLLRKLYEIVIGPHGSPFGDGKVAQKTNLTVVFFAYYIIFELGTTSVCQN